jgi:hypothetical protein
MWKEILLDCGNREKYSDQGVWKQNLLFDCLIINMLLNLLWFSVGSMCLNEGVGPYYTFWMTYEI